MTVEADEAYAQCEQITWEQARNFAYGIRLLPPDKRRGLAAVYAYARRIDDIGDGDLPAPEKTVQLEAARQQVHTLVATIKGDASAEASGAALDDTDPVLVALLDAGTRFHTPIEAFEELIDGCLADVHQAQYKTFDDLHHYCRCVAGSIGRLSLGVYRGVSGGSPLLSRGVNRGVAPPGKYRVAPPGKYRAPRGNGASSSWGPAQ